MAPNILAFAIARCYPKSTNRGGVMPSDGARGFFANRFGRTLSWAAPRSLASDHAWANAVVIPVLWCDKARSQAGFGAAFGILMLRGAARRSCGVPDKIRGAWPV